MKSNTTTTALTAIVCLLGARTEATAQRSHPQAASSAQENPASIRTPLPSTPISQRLLTPISQSRVVYALAFCFDGSGDEQVVGAPGLGPFEAYAVAAGTCGFADSYQNSEILDDGIVASGYASADLWSLGFSAFSYSSTEVRFSVATPAAYRATGSLQGFGGVVVELRDNLVSHFRVETVGAIDEFGLLAAGEYVLHVSAAASSTNPLAMFDLTFDVRSSTPLPDPSRGRGLRR